MKVRSRTSAPGMDARGSLPDRTNWPGTSGSTLDRSRSAATCASAPSHDPTTCRCIWSVTEEEKKKNRAKSKEKKNKILVRGSARSDGAQVSRSPHAEEKMLLYIYYYYIQKKIDRRNMMQYNNVKPIRPLPPMKKKRHLYIALMCELLWYSSCRPLLSRACLYTVSSSVKNTHALLRLILKTK